MTNVEFLKRDIAQAAEQLAAEQERTGQSWLVCFATLMQVLEMDVSILGRSDELPQAQRLELKNKYQTLKIKHQKILNGEEKLNESELMLLVSGLL